MVQPVAPLVYARATLLDSSALIAILDPRERSHTEVRECLELLGRRRDALYVSTFVIAETHRRLLYKPHVGRGKALEFLKDIFDGSYNIVRPTSEDEKRAFTLLERFSDQDVTFTDASSMAIMLRMGLRKVLTLDWHFTLLGFQTVP